MNDNLSSDFIQNIVSLDPNSGKIWLDKLSNIVESLAEQWNLSELIPFDNLTFNYVLSGLQTRHFKNKTTTHPIVIKIIFDNEAFEQEVKSLSCFSYHKGPLLYNVDKENRALLIERAVPGYTLKSYFPDKENESLKIISELIKEIHNASQPNLICSFPKLKDWFKAIHLKVKINQNHLNKALDLIKKISLQSSPSDSVLLHGDFHHDNILKKHEGWMVIDPKGVWGDKTYDIGVFMLNPIDILYNHPKADAIITHRLDYLSKELVIPRQKILDMTYIFSVLATCWSIEDNLDPKNWIKMTQLLDTFYTIDNIPIIETKHLVLRAWKPSDLAPFSLMNQDPLVMEYLPQILNPEETLSFYNRIQNHFTTYGFGLFAVELKDTKEFIGYIGLSCPSFRSHFTPCVEIGWRLARPHWNKGYASEGAKAVLTYAFDELKLNEIVSFTVPQNIPSRRVMEKIGLILNENGYFDHPSLPVNSPLKKHVLYRKKNSHSSTP